MGCGPRSRHRPRRPRHQQSHAGSKKRSRAIAANLSPEDLVSIGQAIPRDAAKELGTQRPRRRGRQRTIVNQASHRPLSWLPGRQTSRSFRRPCQTARWRLRCHRASASSVLVRTTRTSRSPHCPPDTSCGQRRCNRSAGASCWCASPQHSRGPPLRGSVTACRLIQPTCNTIVTAASIETTWRTTGA